MIDFIGMAAKFANVGSLETVAAHVYKCDIDGVTYQFDRLSPFKRMDLGRRCQAVFSRIVGVIEIDAETKQVKNPQDASLAIFDNKDAFDLMQECVTSCWSVDKSRQKVREDTIERHADDNGVSAEGLALALALIYLEVNVKGFFTLTSGMSE